MINRPVRERDVETIVESAVVGVNQSGWDELSLLSLSTTDYTGLPAAISGIQAQLADSRTNVVVPSLRVDSVAADIYDSLSREAPATFTFAPEAGSQRLRDVINKQITQDDVLRTTQQAFAAGAKRLKLYFMIGLPTETDADLDALVELVKQVVALAPRGGSQVTVSISPFAPKPHTPFQWAGQVAKAEMHRRNRYLDDKLRKLRVKVSLRDPEVSALEALLGVGDARVGDAVLLAWQLGARCDGWTECFDPALWQQAFAAVGVDPDVYLAPRDPGGELPWDCVQAPVDQDFLRTEWQAAQAGQTLSDCRVSGECYDCAACSEILDHVFASSRPGVGGTVTPERGLTASSGGSAAGETDGAPNFDPRNASREDAGREDRRWRIWRQQAAAKCWYRAEHTKEGDLCWLGHLDFQRQLHLALRRSGLPIAYSKGYHPHPLLKFGPPLPVGVSGQRETFDIAFAHESPGWEKILNAFLPAGLDIVASLPMGAFVPVAIDQFTSRLDYWIELPAVASGGPDPAVIQHLVEKFLASEIWPYLRPRPKGDVEVDARALVCNGALKLIANSGEDQPAEAGAILQVSLLKSTGEANLPIHHFLSALCGEQLLEPRWCRIERTGMYGRSFSGRWLTPLEEVGEGLRRRWLRRQIQQ
jgi:radical SAM-linked protein